jgi:electron transfer flavoprotein beta subunit
LHIIVCIKSVIVRAPTRGISRTPEACELNPFDRPVLELALNLKERWGGTITALSMGPEAAEEVLHEALAMGVDRGILISDLAFAGSDTVVTSRVLSAAIDKLRPFDIALFGATTADSDTGQVGPQTAMMLDCPLVAFVRSIEGNPDVFRISRSVDGFSEIFETRPPALLTVHPASSFSRYIPLEALDRAFGVPVETWSLKDIGLEHDEVGEVGSPTVLISMNRVVKERHCELVEGTVEEQAALLVTALMDRGVIE